MDWTSVLTVIATGAATLSGVWINGRISSRSEARRLAAEQQRFEAGNARDDAKQQREDDAAEAALVAQAREADATTALEVVERLLDVLREVRTFQEVDAAGFDDHFEDIWGTRHELILRQSVGRIRDESGRSRLVTVMDALGDFQPFAPFTGAIGTRRFVDDTLTLGTELAQAISRGQEPDDEHSQQFAALNQSLTEWNSFLERAARVREQRERERLEREAKEEREEYKREEAAYEAMIDAATEAGAFDEA